MGCSGWGIRATPEGWIFLPERQRPTGINIFENGMRWPTYDLTDNDNGPIILVYSGVTVIATHGLGEASQTTINTTTSAVTHTATTTTEVSVKNDFRASKKSKWDMATNH